MALLLYSLQLVVAVLKKGHDRFDLSQLLDSHWTREPW
jgi:hypothetical protein